MNLQTIAGHREEIDLIHKELYSLLVRRRDSTMAIWKLKQEQDLPFFNAERETQILADFVAQDSQQGKDPLMDTLLTNVMRSILREYETYLRSNFP